MGVGNPDNLAKKLDETLSLVSEEPEDGEPVLKQIRKVTRRPRLFSAADLALSGGKRVIPKDTPKKFFKSKAGVSTNSDPPEESPSPRENPTRHRNETKEDEEKSEEFINTPERKNKSKLPKLKTVSSSSLKENMYNIFEDDNLKTPVNTKTRQTRSSLKKTSSKIEASEDKSQVKSIRKSTRKTASKKASEPEVEAKSTLKPPRLKIVSETESSTNGRRKALKRL